MTSERTKILFVCLGNICRSPLAENVFRQRVREAGLEERFEIDSAGTSAYHVGEAPDRRAAETARRRGLELQGRARQLEPEDLERFDFVIAMDAENLREVEHLAAMAEAAGAEIHLLREFDPEADGLLDVPDPYFGGPRGFEEVHDMVERACDGLLEHLRERR